MFTSLHNPSAFRHAGMPVVIGAGLPVAIGAGLPVAIGAGLPVAIGAGLPVVVTAGWPAVAGSAPTKAYAAVAGLRAGTCEFVGLFAGESPCLAGGLDRSSDRYPHQERPL